MWRLRRGGAILTFLVFALLAAGCGGGGTGDDPGDARSPDPTPASTTTSPPTTTSTATKSSSGESDPEQPDTAGESWTVLVYVMGDTDLEMFALVDLEEMAQVDTTGDLNIVALVDRTPDVPGLSGYTDAGVLGSSDWEGTRQIVFSDGGVDLGEPPEGTDEVELNLGSSGSIAGFVAAGLNAFPADRTALVVWDHGAGWPGMGPDESDGDDVLNLAELREGVRAGLDEAGVERLDLIGFDACLMATYEVAAAVTDLADFLVASEELEPGHGWDYRALNALATGQAKTGDELGVAIAEGFLQHAVDYGTAAEVTLSVIDLEAFGGVQSALADFVEPMISYPSEAAPEVARAVRTAQQYGSSPNPEHASHIFDLGDFAAGLTGLGVDEEIANLQTAIDAAVLHKVAGPTAGRATGLSIYLPTDPTYFDPGYPELGFAPVWTDFLLSHHRAGTEIPEEVTARFLESDWSNLNEYFFDEDGINIVGYVDPAAEGAIAEAVIYYGVVDPADGELYVIGEEAGWVSDDGRGLVFAIYDLTILTVSDGIDTAYAYTDFLYDEELDLLLFDVPLVYEPSSAEGENVDLVLSLAIDGTTSEVVGEIYFQIDEYGQWSEFTADPSGYIWPIVQVVNDDESLTWVESGEVPLFADLPSLQYSFEPLDPGLTLVAELSIVDYAGNSDFLYLEDVVP